MRDKSFLMKQDGQKKSASFFACLTLHSHNFWLDLANFDLFFDTDTEIYTLQEYVFIFILLLDLLWLNYFE